MHGRSPLLHCTCDLKATFTAKGNNPKDFWTGVELCYQTCKKRSIFRKFQQFELDWHNANAVKNCQIRMQRKWWHFYMDWTSFVCTCLDDCLNEMNTEWTEAGVVALHSLPLLSVSQHCKQQFQQFFNYSDSVTVTPNRADANDCQPASRRSSRQQEALSKEPRGGIQYLDDVSHSQRCERELFSLFPCFPCCRKMLLLYSYFPSSCCSTSSSLSNQRSTRTWLPNSTQC